LPESGRRLVGRPGSGLRFLLCGALLLLGFTGGLGAQAAELPLRPSPDPRPADPAGPADTAAQLPAGAAEAALCRVLAEVAPAGAAAVFAGAAGLPAGAFSGFSDTLPTAAEPSPPAGSETAGPAAQAGAGTPGAGATAGATAAAAQLQPASAAATPSPPPPLPPEPHPPVAFDTSLGVPHKPFGKLIYKIARNYALNPLLVAAMVQVESDFNPRARSRKGACGLMQVLPSTARRFGLPRRRDLFNPRKNLETASRYLRWLVNRFGDDPMRVLAAYNAGEGAVERFGGVPPFAETRGYVQRIFAQLGFSALLDAPAAGGAAGVGSSK
jgi:soluble lytic murein transglycosylase-like protein